MVKLGYKQTDIGAIPIDWDETQIKNVGYLTSGESPAHFDFSIGQIPYFKVEQLNNSVKYQAESPYHTYSTKTIDKGSIIFPKRGAAIATNKVRILGQPSLLDTNIMALTITNEEVHGEYLYYWMVRKGLWQIADTTSVPQINNKHILPLWFPLPPIVEQENIGNALADIDELITIFDRLIEKKKAIKLGAMQELLTGKKRLPGFSGEWQHSCLGESAELSTTTISSKLIDSRYYVGTDNMVADRGGVKDNELSLTYANVREYKAGDILLSNIRPYLKKIWYATRDGGCSNDVLVIRRKESEELDSRLLYYILATDEFFDEIMAYAVGTKMPRGDKSVIKSYKICFPKDISEQQAIAEILSNMDSEIEALEQKLEKYRQVKRGMMQQLLTGKIRLV